MFHFGGSGQTEPYFICFLHIALLGWNQDCVTVAYVVPIFLVRIVRHLIARAYGIQAVKIRGFYTESSDHPPLVQFWHKFSWPIYSRFLKCEENLHHILSDTPGRKLDFPSWGHVTSCHLHLQMCVKMSIWTQQFCKKSLNANLKTCFVDVRVISSINKMSMGEQEYSNSYSRGSPLLGPEAGPTSQKLSTCRHSSNQV